MSFSSKWLNFQPKPKNNELPKLTKGGSVSSVSASTRDIQEIFLFFHPEENVLNWKVWEHDGDLYADKIAGEMMGTVATFIPRWMVEERSGQEGDS